ncbi:aa3-type cytochrome oxidase subunit IV [Saccharothrix sp. ST-888]|uniref:aa3-type cytochrome oxidase subunit IV n=1 Tax=Saccharothrix sp. ST-888 TaxID=1427391 RepID=UPI0005ECC254|nr:cytochrome c oxidase subunit 4 [Saccharothrix sp. ST-888]KJK59333.1 membrane protein [Saccharothrix sp. ST-888]
MRAESALFAGVAAFFAVTGALYGWLAAEPAGTVALTVAFLMSGLLALFCWTQHVKRGERLQDRADIAVVEGAGPLDFFAPHSLYPVLCALGAALFGLGVVFGVWLVLIGFGVLVPGTVGFVFQYGQRER